MTISNQKNIWPESLDPQKVLDAMQKNKEQDPTKSSYDYVTYGRNKPQPAITDLPQPNINFDRMAKAIASSDPLCEEELRALACNPAYIGLGELPKVFTRETWAFFAKNYIRIEGLDQFLSNLLYTLEHCFPAKDSHD